MKKKSISRKIIVIAVIVLFFGVGITQSTSGNIKRCSDELDLLKRIGNTNDDWPIDSQSTTGPIPPLGCYRGLNPNLLTGQTVIDGIPVYLWRHGCGSTAAGMVIGYWDGHGYDDLIPGNASTQTHAVNQAIASGGHSSNPNPPGSEQHYEDYARPEDYPPPMLPDDYITQGRIPHSDDCIGDYMDTSKSTRNNCYGWSWFNDVDDALLGYVNWVEPKYKVVAYNLEWGWLTWDNFCIEIDANHPVILLVDTDGNGQTDHFVTAIGYDDSHNYACYDTWDTNIHWYDFTQISIGNTWGIYGATFCVFQGISFTKPKPSFYILNNDVMELPSFQNYQWPFSEPLIVGPIDIEVQVSGASVIDRVEFYIDGNPKYNDTTEPYGWKWREIAFFQHTIKVVAYDAGGPIASNEMKVWKFF